MSFIGEGPNLLQDSELPSIFAQPSTARGTRPVRRRSTKSRPPNAPLPVIASQPVFEKNRCTIVLSHGDPLHNMEGTRRRRFVVPVDLSRESGYALEWCVGTLARDGDELIAIIVLESEVKCKWSAEQSKEIEIFWDMTQSPMIWA